MSNHFLYILECSNHSYYTGYTSDIERRYQEHVAGTAKCKYTRSFPPVRLAACWKIQAPRRESLSLERKIKALSKSEKMALIAEPEKLHELVPSTKKLIIISMFTASNA